MVVHEVNIDGVLAVETEGDAPVAADGHRIQTGKLRGQFMETPAGDIHLTGGRGRIERN